MLKKKRFRFMSAALSMVITAGMMLSGCGSKPADTKKAETEKVTVEFWTISLRPTFDNFFNDLIKNYEDKNPNVKVNWTDLPYDAVQSKLVASIAGNASPDVVNLNTEMALTLAGKGALVDLNKEAKAEQKSVYIETLFNSAKIKDGIYAFPWYGAPSILIYNKDLMQKAGIDKVPTTFDEMLTLAPQMKEKTGAYLYIPDLYADILQFDGIKLVNDDVTKAVFNNAESAELLKKYKDLVEKDMLPRTNWGSWDQMLQQLSTGKLAMVNIGAQTLKRIKDEAPDIYKNLEIASPMVGKAGVIKNPLMNLVVPTASKNKQAAIDFAHYITNDENQLAFCKAVQIFPSTTKAAADPFFRADTSTLETKSLKIIADQLPKTQDFSIGTPKSGEIFDAINKAAEAVMLQNKDIKAALDEAETRINDILSQK